VTGLAAPPGIIERMLAPGADAALRDLLHAWLETGPRARTVLDVGAGVRSRVAATRPRVVALDVSPTLVARGARTGVPGVAASATALPFADASFDATASLGLLHHLSDADARATVSEMVRVTRPRGPIALFDSVLPEPAWRRPLAWAIRRADRGRFVRGADAVRALLPDPSRWQTTRITYAHTGLEGLWCTRA
jgi:SAM-dependent methyltransferase